MSSPAVPDGPGSLWSRFPLDPRSSGDLRAGDADRETARHVLAEAYADGQLSHEEYEQRMDGALGAQHLGQLVPLLQDLALRPAGSPPATKRSGSPAPRRPHWTQSGLGRGSLFVLGITNLIWAATCLTTGTLIYYWPIWPAIAVVISVLAVVLFGRSSDPPPSDAR